jgi:formate transporter
VGLKTPQEITRAGIEKGAAKARLPWHVAFVAGVLAGAYIALGGLVAIAVSSGMDEAVWGTLPVLFAGLVFSMGLILVMIAGSELLTGNMALVPIALFDGRTTGRELARNFAAVLAGNLAGALLVAYFLAVQSGVVTAELPLARLESIAVQKGIELSNWEIFLRGVGANWLVCLAVWLALAAEDAAGKILGIVFPILGFVAMGFDHVIANMFFLPAAIWAGVDVTWLDTLRNWLFSGVGNLLGAVVFVAGAKWYLTASGYPQAEPGDAADA